MIVTPPQFHNFEKNTPPLRAEPEGHQLRDKLFDWVSPKQNTSPIKSVYIHQKTLYVSSRSGDIVGSRWALSYPENEEFQTYVANQLKSYTKVEDPDTASLICRLLEFNRANPPITVDIGYEQVKGLEQADKKVVHTLLDSLNMPKA
jgi:hypothetical protein